MQEQLLAQPTHRLRIRSLLVLQVKGEIDVVDYTVTVWQGTQPTTYCAPTIISQGFYQDASCSLQPFSSSIFSDIVHRAFVEADATLCLTGGPVVEFLTDHLGLSSDELCFAELDIKYYEVRHPFCCKRQLLQKAIQNAASYQLLQQAIQLHVLCICR